MQPWSSPARPRLYHELASWWPLLSAPAEYAEEAGFYHQVFQESGAPISTMLELGSGGGNNASHLKAWYTMTLVDISGDMLAQSQAINPECEHLMGDMRRVRLGRLFDAVFVHDAVMYMTTEQDLSSAIETAFAHTRPGGTALFAPDSVQENFKPDTDFGGHDSTERSLRYLQWTWDPDPSDTTYTVDFAYMLREADGSIRVEGDRHVFGLFPTATWLRVLGDAGFQASAIPFEHPDLEKGALVFAGRRPAG